MRILKVWVLAAAVLFGWQLPAAALQEIPLVVEGGTVSGSVYLSGFPGPVTFVPVRDLCLAAGFSFRWYGETGSVVCETGGQVAVITRDLEIIYLVEDGIREVDYQYPGFVEEGRMYVPIRMLELLGIKVSYDAPLKTIRLTLPIISNPPTVSADEAYRQVKEKIEKELAQRPKKIASYVTYFDPGNKNRSKNLLLAVQALDGYRLNPGEVFSFNEIVGPRVPARGYLKAIVFVNKKKVEDFGGGVCQVSTTLYNVVLEAGLPVLERHPHSLPVSYVSKGRDATVSYGSADLKFRNNTESIVFIRAFIEKNKLIVELFRETISTGLSR